MLLAIDAGNTHIVLGCLEGDSLLFTARVHTDRAKTADEYALTFRSVNNALYGIVAMYISSLAMDTVVYGSLNAKIAYIISGHSGEVAKRLLGLDLGITLALGAANAAYFLLEWNYTILRLLNLTGGVF